MPTASMPMIFTWSVESLLLGLVALAVCEEDYLIYAQLATCGLTLALHLVALALQWDGHHSISVSYLCVVTSMLLAAASRPLGSVGSLILLAFFLVIQIAALGMTFTSCVGRTPLFLSQRGHFAMLIGVTIELAGCWSKWATFVILFLITASQCVPFATATLSVSIVGAAGILVVGVFLASWVQAGVGGVVLLTSAAWLVAVWWLPVPTEKEEDTAPSAPPAPVRQNLMVWPRIRPQPPLFKDL